MKKLLAAVFTVLLVIVMSVTLAACDANVEVNVTPGGDKPGTEQPGGENPGGEQPGGENPGGNTQTNVDVTISDVSKKVNLEGHNLYLVSIGQSAVYGTVETLLKNMGLTAGEDYTASTTLTANDVAEGDVVIIAAAASSKGMGSAGTDAAKELQRANGFAAKQGITLIVVQTNGESGRGESSDPYFAALCPKAHLTLIVEKANTDGKFSTVWCPEGTLYVYSRANKIADSLKFVLGVA